MLYCKDNTFISYVKKVGHNSNGDYDFTLVKFLDPLGNEMSVGMNNEQVVNIKEGQRFTILLEKSLKTSGKFYVSGLKVE